jgi:hypothetical protein
MNPAIRQRAGPKRKRRLQRRSQELRLLATYYLTAILQSPLGALFWAL